MKGWSRIRGSQWESEMYNNQRVRLLRESPWPNAQALAEELYAMFASTDPVEIPEGIHLQIGDTDRFPIEIDGYGDDEFPLLRINRTGGSFDVLIDASGDLITRGVEEDGDAPADETAEVSATSTFPGKVVSGSGATYSVDIYQNGLSQTATRVTVTQLQIDASETIPADTWATVTRQSDGSYFMQVPVWM